MLPLLLQVLIAAAILPVNQDMDTYNGRQAQKLIDIKVTADGWAITGRDTISVLEIADELRTRLWKSYLGTGKMPTAIRISYDDNVPLTTRETAEKAVKEAQGKALTELCLQKNKKRFEELSDNQQNRIRKKFPILFQQQYSNP